MQDTMLGGAGTTTGALIFGGEYPGGGLTRAYTESWNGTNWTEVNDISNGRAMCAQSAGTTNTACYCCRRRTSSR